MTITSRVKDELFETNEARPIRIATSIAPPSSGFHDDLPAIRSRGAPWSQEEHERFLDALAQFPYGPWRVIADHIGTRTARQAMSHAQKYRQKITRRKRDAAKHKASTTTSVQRTERQVRTQLSGAAGVEQQVPAQPPVSRYELPSLSMQAYVDASELPFGAFDAGANSGYDNNNSAQLPAPAMLPSAIPVTSAVNLAELSIQSEMLDWQTYLLALSATDPVVGAPTSGNERHDGFFV